MNKSRILILGANSDMAQATAKRFAEAGYNLYMASRNLTELTKTCQDLSSRYGVEANPIHFDARAFDTHAEFYQLLKIRPVGVIVAFGAMHDQVKAENDFSLAREVIETNYLGAVGICNGLV